MCISFIVFFLFSVSKLGWHCFEKLKLKKYYGKKNHTIDYTKQPTLFTFNSYRNSQQNIIYILAKFHEDT